MLARQGQRAVALLGEDPAGAAAQPAIIDRTVHGLVAAADTQRQRLPAQIDDAAADAGEAVEPLRYASDLAAGARDVERRATGGETHRARRHNRSGRPQDQRALRDGGRTRVGVAAGQQQHARAGLGHAEAIGSVADRAADVERFARVSHADCGVAGQGDGPGRARGPGPACGQRAGATHAGPGERDRVRDRHAVDVQRRPRIHRCRPGAERGGIGCRHHASADGRAAAVAAGGLQQQGSAARLVDAAGAGDVAPHRLAAAADANIGDHAGIDVQRAARRQPGGSWYSSCAAGSASDRIAAGDRAVVDGQAAALADEDRAPVAGPAIAARASGPAVATAEAAGSGCVGAARARRVAATATAAAIPAIAARVRPAGIVHPTATAATEVAARAAIGRIQGTAATTTASATVAARPSAIAGPAAAAATAGASTAPGTARAIVHVGRAGAAAATAAAGSSGAAGGAAEGPDGATCAAIWRASGAAGAMVVDAAGPNLSAATATATIAVRAAAIAGQPAAAATRWSARCIACPAVAGKPAAATATPGASRAATSAQPATATATRGRATAGCRGIPAGPARGGVVAEAHVGQRDVGSVVDEQTTAGAETAATTTAAAGGRRPPGPARGRAIRDCQIGQAHRAGIDEEHAHRVATADRDWRTGARGIQRHAVLDRRQRAGKRDRAGSTAAEHDVIDGAVIERDDRVAQRPAGRAAADRIGGGVDGEGLRMCDSYDHTEAAAYAKHKQRQRGPHAGRDDNTGIRFPPGCAAVDGIRRKKDRKVRQLPDHHSVTAAAPQSGDRRRA